MAHGAGRGESCRSMIRICRSVVIRLVARIAVCRNRLVIAVDVALRAGNRGMSARKGEYRSVVERRLGPRRGAVAQGATRREA